MPIIDLQTRSRELGRIRLGVKEAFTKRNGEPGTRPAKLDRFRLTSASQPLLEKVAELYGGQVQPWTPDGGSPAFEVITDARRLPILVPQQPVTQWYEAWRKSGCIHRCDGRTNVLTDEPCDPEDPLHREATDKPTTRLNVVLRDVEGIGVWRVETKGWHAAVELPDVAEFLAQAGGYVAGWLALEQRTSVDNSGPKPVTQHFMVPIIEIDVTPAQLLAGGGRVSPAALTGGPVPAAAIEAPAEPVAVDQRWGIFHARLEQSTTLDQLRDLWSAMVEAGMLGSHAPATQEALDFNAAYTAKGQALGAVAQPVPDADGAVEAEIVPDDETPSTTTPAAVVGPDAPTEPNPDAVWQQIVATGGRLGMSLPQITEDCTARLGGVPVEEATGSELAMYLTHLQATEQQAVAS